MSATSRREQIVAILQREGRVRIGEISERFAVTTETLRRDLAALEQQQIVKKVHGGAVLADGSLVESSFHARKQQQIEKKRLIADLAIGFIRDHDAIMFDASTTAFCVAEKLTDKRNVTVITNSLQALNALVHSSAKIIGLGGELDHSVGAFVGTNARAQLSNLHATRSFISCYGIDTALHTMDISPEEASIKETFLQNSSTRYLLMDSSKFGRKGTVKIHGLEHIDYLLTDRPPDRIWLDIFQQHNIQVICP